MRKREKPGQPEEESANPTMPDADGSPGTEI